MPTTEQNFASVCVCQMRSNYYRDIQLFRYNSHSGIIYIFANDELQIVIPRNGNWRFLDEAEL
ncbi:DUF6888 family protein [Stenomitos frigidus]|uniref:DUF6888 domain-containing protein n=1 Tax=Stenomitos frigidus ULC18 TaxID=2107698 RepID=A0A2T1E6Z3_9CYAN|nr:hypothetical protein C7B82_13625 [Stenomitos frigidus ULC18]